MRKTIKKISKQITIKEKYEQYINLTKPTITLKCEYEKQNLTIYLSDSSNFSWEIVWFTESGKEFDRFNGFGTKRLLLEKIKHIKRKRDFDLALLELKKAGLFWTYTTEKEETAQSMFYKSGFNKRVIQFNKLDKPTIIYENKNGEEIGFTDNETISVPNQRLNVKVLKAINKQVKELGWK